MKLGILGLMAAAGCMVAGTAQSAVIITGIVDGDLSGGNPKAIELYIDGTEDLSAYTLERSANGGSFSSVLSLTGSYTDTFVYLVGTGNSGEAQFDSVFGTTGIFANRILSGNVNGNGNDAFRIVNGTTVIDQILDTSGSNVHVDSFVYRKDNTGPDGGFVVANFDFAGNGFLDGLSAAEHTAAIPFGTFVIPEPASLALVALGGLVMVGRRGRRA